MKQRESEEIERRKNRLNERVRCKYPADEPHGEPQRLGASGPTDSRPTRGSSMPGTHLPHEPGVESRCNASAGSEPTARHMAPRSLEHQRTMAALINAGLRDEMRARPETMVFGEDVGKKGGVYGVSG